MPNPQSPIFLQNWQLIKQNPIKIKLLDGLVKLFKIQYSSVKHLFLLSAFSAPWRFVKKTTLVTEF
ncbi:hypothetical protein A6769_00115 [Nostoc punctiforme NIES-2108]|uniref:Uncharacterized protein n=1 Tax=Nostoc punctiforme NIES-2108 TaxID=1356359 RepID=A0A367RZD9_NOSPU|nr:hypothetical protein A6769_00115 [Nostoc punctiforme NIES-2108]